MKFISHAAHGCLWKQVRNFVTRGGGVAMAAMAFDIHSPIVAYAALQIRAEVRVAVSKASARLLGHTRKFLGDVACRKT